MRMRKRTVFLISALYSTAYAGQMGNEPSSVSFERKAWHFGAQALYLQPRYSGYNQLGVLGNTPLGDSPTQLRFQAVNDTWGWGFKVDAAYDFHTGNDINVNWLHYNTTTNRGTIAVPAGSSFTDGLSNEYTSGNISTLRRPSWDAVNAEFGQMYHFDAYDDVRFHGGLQFARIKTQTSISLPNAVDSTTYTTQKIVYTGVGPRIGIDMGYHLKSVIVLYANGAASILIGPTHFYDTGMSSGGHNTLQLVEGSATAIVPELDVKLGVKYLHPTARGTLRFDLGWMLNNYFSAQVNNHATDTHESDFAIQGLFFGFIWKSQELT